MRRKLLVNCSEAGKLVSSSKRSKSDSPEHSHGNSPDNIVIESDQTVEIPKEVIASVQKVEDNSPIKVSRKMVALFMSYNGYGYHGMQYNAGTKTIEGELLEAVFKAGAISEEVKFQLGHLKFQRTSKTDKGVSAVRQIVSLKMDVLKSHLDGINSFLPPQIRVFRILRVTQSFNGKHFCSSRFYNYICPTFAFAPTYEQTYEGYRIDAETVGRLQNVLSIFKGTHNFHNYTSAVKAKDPSCNRYIINVSLGLPFLDQKSKLEFISIHLQGQSFMLHQIRKMIGITIAVMKNFANEEIIARSFKLDTVETPKAPSLGLMLEKQEFNGYNRKFGDDGIHERIEWESLENEVVEFRDKYIYPHIIQQESEHKSMFIWLGNLNKHNFVAESDESNKQEDNSQIRGDTHAETKTKENAGSPKIC
ncbi:tRNA pseudouridine synthase A, mitochondrial-like [Oopsacas minuta]|uniref:Pseudouridylate synthase 1 homolog n=1 Tax=Oopsacas minuta TaxID=111878 RepID=A0AAV7KEP6_9METZ|nr:tRNA pseudouridine synthase A, mitochondrial-like [Oopsacas minuta]